MKKIFALFCFAVFLWPLPVLGADAPPAVDADLVAQVISLLSAHAWVPLAALVVGLLVRLWKTDWMTGKLQAVPSLAWAASARYRPLIATVLGLASGALEHAAMHQPWVPALVGGLVSAAIATWGHGVVIEGALAGKEIGAGDAAKAGAVLALVGALGGGATALTGCGASLGQVIADIAQGVSFLNGALGMAEDDAQGWFASHPGDPKKAEVEAALQKAHDSSAILDALGKTGKDASSGDVAGAKADALQDYAAVYKLLEDVGAAPQSSPPGSKKLLAKRLPTPAEVAAKLGVAQ